MSIVRLWVLFQQLQYVCLTDGTWTIVAVFPIPCPSQHFRCRLTSNGSLICAIHGPNCQLAYARLLITDDGGLPGRSFR